MDIKDNIKDKITDLVKRLNYHSHRYYTLDNPEISDTEYDKMYRELKDLESMYPDYILDNSPTKRVGDKLSSLLEKKAHTEAMLSLSNIFSFDELVAFDKRVKSELGIDKLDYTLEGKLDGVAVSIRYRKGLFTEAISRGDGELGEDITSNVKTIRNIPLKIESLFKDFEIRGEVIIPKRFFYKLNEEKINNNEKPFANARNCASGSIRQLDPKVAAKRPLYFYAHSFTSSIDISSQDKALAWAKEMGFSVFKHHSKTSNLDEIKNFYEKVLKIRNNLDIEIDGVVIKVDSKDLQKKLGNNNKSPKWAVAWKPPAHFGESIVEDIKLQVGRTGVLTPVAKLRATKVGGVVVKKATLHNASELSRKDIRIGDSVIIERAGDVIPAVKRVLKEKRKDNTKLFTFPSICPICKTKLVKTKINYICPNINCPAKLKEQLKHFASALGIDGLGTKLIDKLVDSKILNSFSSLYDLLLDEISQIDRMGEKSSKNILRSINRSKNTSLSKFIYALGIEHIGKETAKELANYLKTSTNLINKSLSLDNLTQIKSIGPVVGKSIYDYFQNEDNISQIKNLLSHGFNFETNKPKNKELEYKLDNKKLAITGLFEDVSRNKIINLIENSNGKYVSSISKSTDYLILGKNPGSKFDKAKEFGVKTISLKDFYTLIGIDNIEKAYKEQDLFQKEE